MGMHDRDWYKERYKKTNQQNNPGRAWSNSEKNQWQSKLDAANRKNKTGKLAKNIALFLVLSFASAMAIKVTLGKEDLSVQSFLETLGLGKLLSTAPNGSAWPEKTGYLPGQPVLATEGRGSITIDNRNGKQDAYVQLLQSDSPVRQIYVRRNDSFELTAVTPGTYQLKVLEIQSGQAYKVVEPITLGINRSANSISWDNKTIRLQAESGNLSRERIPKSQMRH
ncbi:hypothetical protein [Thiopseudomonas denitrificans]|uniref:Uncharacterized protein n=1 Tax=Thiopseudomonas denitrificans TaxID=1501432 RepID=A0A4R6TRP3_9GAMM|nr:hypothetical protein [Thiopseudomonas denitrificans]TDQ35362.1 hypothetical protein DFQ45_11652 [Thiopseudomonas denitrificans]